MNVIGCKWVFKKKKDVNGSVQKYKARLVAKGYNQEYGVDYSETFAPVLYKSLRLILALSSYIKDGQLEQLDIKTAFLNATVTEDIYMDVPEGMTESNNTVVKLNKALYGIKQAPREWNSNVNEHLVMEQGFQRCMKDSCIYVKKSKNGNNIIVGIFVDDMVILYSNEDKQEWNKIKEVLKGKYELSDLGNVQHILGMRVSHTDDNKLCIDQQVYIDEKLKLFKMDQCYSLATPENADKLRANDSDYITDVTEYRSIVGSLIYASVSTRPDITHAVNMVSRYMGQPTRNHMLAAKRILRYLKGTKEYGLQYNTTNTDKEITVTAYCDADWGGSIDDRKSTSGYGVFVNNNLISWNTKKQRTVALSSAEAELMSVTEVTKEVTWYTQLFRELAMTFQHSGIRSLEFT